MKALENRILVKVDFAQKDFSSGLQLGKEFDTNYRNKRPVMCQSLEWKGGVSKGDFLLVHHNFFYEGSPYQFSDDIFSIKLNQNIFSRLDKEGVPHSIFGNVMAERIPIQSALEMPPEYQKNYNDRCKVIDNGEGYSKGTVILHYPFGDYQIIYNWKGEERTVIKVWKEDIYGKLLEKS